MNLVGDGWHLAPSAHTDLWCTLEGLQSFHLTLSPITKARGYYQYPVGQVSKLELREGFVPLMRQPERVGAVAKP